MHHHRDWTLRTRTVAGARPGGAGEPLNVPIVGASAYQQGGARVYARGDATPTWSAFEELLADLEGGRAVSFASGMAAISAVLDTVGGQRRIAVPEDCYLGTAALLHQGESTGRWRVTRLPATATDAWVSAAADHDLLWLESPTNPLLQVMDLPRILAAARTAPARTAVDSTFATPMGQQPLAMGADVVVHSATKYLGGHSDLMAGAAVSIDPDLHEQLVLRRTLLGATPGMLEAYLVTRGMRTLALRLDAATASAAILAERFAEHPLVARVRYPGLPSDPSHALAASFMTGFGAMLSVELTGGAERADALCASVRLFRHATSLGGVESTLERRAAQPGQEHVPAGLVRISVGCEDVEDLWRDLSAALDAERAR